MASGSSAGPTAEPLRSLEELQSWTVENLSLDALQNVAQVALLETEEDIASRRHLRARRSASDAVTLNTEASPEKVHRPRLLVCHDLQGGYEDDKLLQGGSNSNAYRIWHWRLIDVFVYFSHHLVTIPPAGWTDAAHRHDVKVLGTFITEWDAGAAICREILSTVESARHVADQLVAIAMHHKFDGWLLNIENKVDLGQIPTLVEFVRYLTETMHAAHPLGEVIWYDSVTTKGELKWQDSLTPLNAPFFAAADGLFVNYTWKAGTPEACALAANRRAPDVYMGVDVFGRGTFGGGGYHADTALAAARSAGVSAALFAPAWVIENPHEAGPNFEEAQEKFWGLVQRCWPAAHPAVTRLPFESDFNQAVGRSLRSDGALVSDRPWNNMARQSVQPLHHAAQIRSAKKRTTLEAGVSFESAFNGGSSYEVRGRLEKGDFAAVRLFDCSLELNPSKSLTISFTVSALPDSHVALLLRIRSADNKTLTIVCSSASAIPAGELKYEMTGRSNVQGTASGETRAAGNDASGTRSGQSVGIAQNSMKPGGMAEQSSTDRRGMQLEAEDRGGSAEHFERSNSLRRQEPGESRAEMSVVNSDGGQFFGGREESASLQSGELHSISWASFRSLESQTNGWQTFVFHAEAGLTGRLTNIGVVCNVGGLLDESDLESVWETMKEHTEDLWVLREREEQNRWGPVENEQKPTVAMDERTADDATDQQNNGKKETGSTRGTVTNQTSESLQPEIKEPSMGSELGRRMLRGSARNVESHEERASHVDGRPAEDHAARDDNNGFRVRLGHVALQYLSN
ncbi:mannosyl-glycoprotein endo-beta-N-acetylglucosaminidase [Klebsormidium nitens]|uniref:mannosyl-glycoprotein endo-beta-N-acetylglucosaminidase n=1 Tax=Klebsormidium nitens TaxID=105231 RepID=A0A1Y1HJR8_KLENI|nr:mannosyl-glycoprotein endo-beta-N-acetylglucosaminidase [Klebsormidium nitens]|eukprot:GAQ78794.1 mannosyl-glycoprotein endo-beta-N-acetylglucosaminidase [Klebsormidium nitens]